MFHWTLHFAAKGRIKRNPSESRTSQCRIKDLKLAKLLPGKAAMNSYKSSFSTLIARVLTKYMPAYSVFKHVVVKHIPHRYSKEMAEKSKQVIISVDSSTNLL